MNIDIFIRTYHKDIPWLNYALESIHKYVTGYRRVIVTIPAGEGHLLKHLTAETVIEVEDMADGYLGQQLTKMEAWKYTDADAVVFWDSDVIAAEPIDVKSEYFHEDKPILYKTRYSSIESPWRAITEKAVKFPVEWEYMRRLPLVYLRSTLWECQTFIEAIQGIGLRAYVERQPLRAFSEFNVIGAFVDEHRRNQYHILDTEAIDLPPNKVLQFWSWGGITAEVREQINKALQ